VTISSRISGIGMYVPERILTNADLERMVDTSDTWIQDRTGVRERHIAADNETASTLGIEASRQALEQAEVDAKDLDLVIAATTSPDGMFPAIASRIQHGLGATGAGAFDVNAACVGFLSALATATQFIATGAYERILVVGSEVLSRIVDWSDRTTCVLFADGAGAVVVEAGGHGGPLSFVLHSDGGGAQNLYADGPCGVPNGLKPDSYYISMDGRQIFKFAVHAMDSATRESIEKAGLNLSDIDLMIPHQANSRIINATTKALGFPPERVMINVDRYGNTSSASIPIALREAWEQGRLHEGDTVAFVTFGGGQVWGAMIYEWVAVGPLRPVAAPVHATAGGS